MSRLSTKHVVLGLLIERRGYGYDLQQRLTSRVGFLQIAESAVYKILRNLETEGLIEECEESTEGPRKDAPRKVGRNRGRTPPVKYRATRRGIEEFQAWMDAPCALAVTRDLYETKLALARQADLRRLVELAEEQVDECVTELASLSRPSLAMAASPDVPLADAARMMIDDGAARDLQARIDWLNAICETLDERIARHEHPPAPG